MSDILIILTSDYEVWGDGSGCVENCVTEPTAEMLAIADKYNVPITFFLDVCEYWAFEKTEEQGKFQGSYRPASIIKDQLTSAVANGHDVQLHFHPQWLNYKFLSNHHWNLDNRYWRLPSVAKYHTSEWNLDLLFKKGKQTLEGLFGQVKADYKTFVFRAGAWCIQPESEVLDAMKNNGILIDSTVAPGRKFDDGKTVYDFTSAPNHVSNWKIGQSIREIGNGQILEIPIFTSKVSSIRIIYYQFLRILRKIRATPVKCSRPKDAMGKSKLEKYLRLFNGSQIRMFNFSDAVVFEEMRYHVQNAIKKSSNKQEIQPIVAISHSKTFANSGEFEKFLSWGLSQSEIRFGTYKDINS